jgi:hypothetical protein
MSKISTSKEWKDYCDAMKRMKKYISKEPRKQTVEVVMQFARSYHVEKQLPSNLSGYVLS